MNTHLPYLLCQSCRSLRTLSLVGPHIPFLGLIKRSTRLAEYYDTIRGTRFQPWLNTSTTGENDRMQELIVRGFSVYLSAVLSDCLCVARNTYLAMYCHCCARAFLHAFHSPLIYGPGNLWFILMICTVRLSPTNK